MEEIYPREGQEEGQKGRLNPIKDVRGGYDKPFDQDRIDEAIRVLDAGNHLLVCKSPRAGFTTSIILAALQKGKKILIVEPTNRLIDETIKTAAGNDLTVIEANRFCFKLQIMAQQDHLLEEIPSVLPACKNCEYENCSLASVAENLRERNVAAITLSKLLTLRISSSERAKEILGELQKFDIVLFDECENLVYPQSTNLSIDSKLEVPDRYWHLSKLIEDWEGLLGKHQIEITELEEAEEDRGEKHLSTIIKGKSLKFRDVIILWQELYDLCLKREREDINAGTIINLKNLVGILSGDQLAFSFIGGEDGGSVVATGLEPMSRMARMILDIAGGAQAILTSATPSEPREGFFSDMLLDEGCPEEERPFFGREKFKEVIFRDLRNTNRQLTIFPDNWKLRHFAENLERIVDRLVEILEEEGDAYILSPTKAKAVVIKDKLKKRGFDMEVDYYRSPGTAGVANKKRVGIAIGRAEVPVNTYDYLVCDGGQEERWIESRRLREGSVEAATYQAWSRIKDPEGEEDSRLYCIGVRGREVTNAIIWGTGRRVVAEKIVEYKVERKTIKTVKFRVGMEDRIEPPNVKKEKKQTKTKLTVEEMVVSRNGYQNQAAEEVFRQLAEEETATGGEYVGHGEEPEKIPPNILLHNSFLHRRNLPRFIPESSPISESTRSLPVSPPHLPGQLSKEASLHPVSSFELLTRFFMSREDAYGKQHFYSGRNGKPGHWGYMKVEIPCSPDPNYSDNRWSPSFVSSAIEAHLSGEITVGSYQASSADDPMARWVML